MTILTDTGPTNPVHPAKAKRHQRSLWPWVTLVAVFSPFLVLGGLWLTNGLPTGPTHQTGFFNITLSAKWHPNPQNAGVYCQLVGQLSSDSEQFAALTANVAPNLAAHQAMIAYYEDVKHQRPSSGDLAKVKATCPS